MLILILIISVILLIVGIILYETDISEDAGIALMFITLLLIIFSIGALIYGGYKLTSYRVIDNKIKLYQTQNKDIEQKIELVVKEYKDYEKDTFTGLKSDSYITLVNLYPKLKSDKMVQQQIDLYTKNNKKITSLKEEKINRTMYRWWVYFGK